MCAISLAPGGCQNHQPCLVCICAVTENENMLSHLQYRVSPVLKMASSSSKGSAVSLSLSHTDTRIPSRHVCTCASQVGDCSKGHTAHMNAFNSLRTKSFTVVVLNIRIIEFSMHYSQMLRALLHQFTSSYDTQRRQGRLMTEIPFLCLLTSLWQHWQRLCSRWLEHI